MLIGITGAMGSGKTTVARFFKEWGASLIQADTIGWKLLDIPQIAETVVKKFGTGVLGNDGNIDRKALGGKAFGSRAELEALNSIVHPPLLKELKDRIDRETLKSKIIVVDAALIVEWKITDWFDELVVVTCPEMIKIRRLIEAGLSEGEAAKRLGYQIRDEERVKYGHFVIDNSGTPEELKKKARAVFDSICAESSGHPTRCD